MVFSDIIKKKKEQKLRLERISKLDAEIESMIEAISLCDVTFNEVSDPGLTAAAIFEKAALEERIGYLIRQRRELG